MGVVSCRENVLPLIENLRRFSVMNGFRGEQSDPGVVMLLVVPGEESPRKGSGIFKGAESVREIGSILESFELRFGKRVIVARVRPAVGLGDAEIAEKECDGFRFHRRAPIGVQSEVSAINLLLAAGFIDQPFGQGGRFSVRNHPPDDVPAEDVQDDVKIEVAPLYGAEKLRNVPRPNPIGACGQELGFSIGGMTQLVPALFHLVVFFKNPVHGPDGAKIVPLIEESCIDLAGSKIDEPIAVEGVEYGPALLRAQGSRRNALLRRLLIGNCPGCVVAIIGCPGYAKGLAGGLDSDIC